MKLFIDSCIREDSRTNILAEAFMEKHPGDWKTLSLVDLGLKPLNEERLDARMAYLNKGDFNNPAFDLAKEFAEAEEILIASPYYDYSFSALLKTYIENIYIIGIVSRYDETGRPIGLCRAKRLTYITTAGGPYDPSYSYEYIKRIATECFGIEECDLIYAENLDIVGYDATAIIEAKRKSL